MNKKSQKGKIKQLTMQWMILIGLLVAIAIVGYYTFNLPEKHTSTDHLGNINEHNTDVPAQEDNSQIVQPDNTNTTEEKAPTSE